MQKLEDDIMQTDFYEPDFFEEEDVKLDTTFEDKKQTLFEVEKFSDYSHEKNQSLCDEYEVVQTFAPKINSRKKENSDFKNFINNQYAFSPSSETYIYQRSKPKRAMQNTTRGKVIICVVAFIAILLSSLCIVNAININATMLQNAQDIETLNNTKKALETEEKINDELNEEINQVSVNTYTEITEENTYKISLLPKKEAKVNQGQTNLFDKFCNFISLLFGGN